MMAQDIGAGAPGGKEKGKGDEGVRGMMGDGGELPRISGNPHHPLLLDQRDYSAGERKPMGACSDSRRRRLRVPATMIAPAAMRTRAATRRVARAPAKKSADRPMKAPKRATPKTLPVCRVALRTPAAMPERAFSTLPRRLAVSGGTSAPRPPPSAMSGTSMVR